MGEVKKNCFSGERFVQRLELNSKYISDDLARDIDDEGEVGSTYAYVKRFLK